MCGHHRHSRGTRPAPSRTTAPPRPDERVGDTERERTLRRLAAHYAAGRLSEAELEERSAAAAAARTAGDLAALERDLPPLRGPGAGKKRPRGARMRVPAGITCHLFWIVPVGASVIW